MKPNIYGLEPASKKSKEEVEDYSKLLDASIHGKKSRFVDPSYKPPHNVTPLMQAVSIGDVQACINLIASGIPFKKHLYNGQTYLHIAAQCGFNSFCEFMLLSGFDVDTHLKGKPVTALLIAAQAQKPSTCKLLLEYGAHPICLKRDFTASIFKYLADPFAGAFKLSSVTPKADIDLLTDICKLLARKRLDRTSSCVPDLPNYRNLNWFTQTLMHLNAGKMRLLQLMPLFMLTGSGPEANAPTQSFFSALITLHRSNLTTLEKSMVHTVATYQAALELKELDAARTVLLIHRFRPDSLLAQVPRDVLKNCILKFVIPFKVKCVEEAVDQQLVIFRRLLARSATETQLDLSSSDLNEIIKLTHPRNVEQFRDELTCLTHILMELPELKQLEQKTP